MNTVIKKLINVLKKKKLKISIVESCTGGLFSSEITSYAGSSKVFNLGLVTYSNKSKINILRVKKKTIRKYGAVSEKTCLAMVKNLSKINNSSIYVSITGIAGPLGGTKNKPVGLVFIGIKKGKHILINKCLFKNKGRTYIQNRAVTKSAKLVLNLLK